MRRGFTLIEMLVYAAVLAGLISAISYFLIGAIRPNAKAAAAREVVNSAQAVLEKITYEMRAASGIYTPTSIFTATSGQLSLETTRYSSPQESTSYIDFYICGQSVCFKKENENPVALTSSRVIVNKLEFSQGSTTSTRPSVQISLGMNNSQAYFNTTSTASRR